MTGCQADYGDDRHCGNCQSLASDIPVREVIIHRQECERPERVYHQLSAQGAAAIKFIPHLQPSDARLWGDFLCAVFAIWIKEDANRIVVPLFEAKLRSHGVTVVEYEEDYGVAVEQGRKAAESDPNCFFIDDENSRTLFLGYAVAGERLKAQFAREGRVVDAGHPLFVYLPCGVGGGPGGVAFGLKLAFGDHVHCLFAEPTHSPCMLLGVYTGLHDQISVQDLGIDNLTAADGLAVGRASGFVGRAMERLLDGFYSLDDQTMYDMLGWLAEEEGIRLEPSALAGMAGPQRVCASEAYQRMHGFTAEQMRNATHLVWATGGGMVPEEEMAQYLAKGR